MERNTIRGIKQKKKIGIMIKISCIFDIKFSIKNFLIILN